MAKQVIVKTNEIPEDWTSDSADFINRVFIYLYLVFTKKTSK